MGLFLPERRASVAPSISLTSGDPALEGYFGASSNTNSGQNVNSQTALSISTVFACVDRKAKTHAMLPLEIKKSLPNGGFEIARKFRLYRQLNLQPNAWQSSFDWRYMGMVHKQLRGNFYCYIQSTPGRGLNQLIPLHPDRIWPFVITPEGVTYYMYDNSPPPPANSKLYYQYFPQNGKTEIFTSKEILHIRGMSDNGIVGKTIVKLMAENIGLSMAMEKQGAKLFTNGAQISKVFKHPNKLDDLAFDRLRNQLDQYTGVENSHRTIILENGMDISCLSMSMQDSQFIECKKFQVEEICSNLDVPMMLIHRSGDKNQTFASAEVINQLYLTHSMQPEFVNWEQRLKIDLLYDSEQDYYFDFDFTAMMRGDSAARASYYKVRFDTGSLKPNDIKRQEGENPYDDVECDMVYVQSGTMPAKLAGQQNQPKVENVKPEVKPNAEVDDETK
jgi:HK97 family phage portal protein